MGRNTTHVRAIARALAVLVMCLSGWCAGNKTPEQADRIVIVKSERTMTLLRHGKVLKAYRVALGREPRGPKTRHGDNRTPEGLYTIDSRNAHSQFHLALHISYPNATDRAHARKSGVDPGGDIMIHGLPPAYAFLGARHSQTDWTFGCIAVTDAEIEEIWSLVPVGTTVEIKP
jgi:murein L,D-transpeptidase YafK